MGEWVLETIRNFDGIDQAAAEEETLLGLSNACVLWFDKARLDFDFPTLAEDERGNRGSAPYESFLIENAAFISLPMTTGGRVARGLKTDDRRRLGLRPPRYGRAAVLPARHEDASGKVKHLGLLDVKGLGVAPGKTPKCAPHRTGLLPLPMAIEEVVNQLIIERYLAERLPNVVCVPLYGLLALGFEGQIPGESDKPTYVPAGAIVRLAHRRPVGGADLVSFGSPEQRVQLQIELALRQGGVTSTTPMTRFEISRHFDGSLEATYGGAFVPGLTEKYLEALLVELGIEIGMNERHTFSGVNVQLARDVDEPTMRARIVDFGHYHYSTDFSDDLLSLVSDRQLNWGGVCWAKDVALLPKTTLPGIRKLGMEKLPPELAAWFGSKYSEMFTAGARFGIELTYNYEKGNIMLNQIPNEINEFVRSAFY